MGDMAQPTTRSRGRLREEHDHPKPRPCHPRLAAPLRARPPLRDGALIRRTPAIQQMGKIAHPTALSRRAGSRRARNH